MPISLPKPAASLGGGDPNVALTGTGKGIRGIDAILEFDGFYLNDRSVIDKYRVTKIDGLADADIRDAREQNPNSHGETPFDSLYGGRTIVITGRIEAHTLTKLRDMETALRQAFNELIEKPLIIRTGNINNDVMIMCRKNAPIAMSDEQKDWTFYRDFMLTLRASNPRFVGYISKSDSNIFGDTDDFNTNAVVSRVNLIPNPAPYDTSLWALSNTVLAAPTTGGPVSNGNRGTLTASAAGTTSFIVQTWNVGDGSGIVEACRGKTVSLSMWLKIASGSALKAGASDMVAQVECSISGGSITNKTIPYTGIATGSWNQKNTIEHTIPINATQVRVLIYNPAAVTLEFSRAMLEIGAFSNDYVDGYQFYCRWVGAENSTYSEKWSSNGLGTRWSVRSNEPQVSIRNGQMMMAGPFPIRTTHMVLNDFKHYNDSGQVTFKFNAAAVTDPGGTDIGAVFGGRDDHYGATFNWLTKKIKFYNMTAGTLNEAAVVDATAITGMVDNTYYWARVTKVGTSLSMTIYSTNPALPSPTVLRSFSHNFTAPGSILLGDDKVPPGIVWSKPAAHTRIDEFIFNPTIFTTTALTVTNEGSFFAQPVFKISGADYLSMTGNGGKAIVLTNLSTGQSMRINAPKSSTQALMASETLVIDGMNDSIYIEETGAARDNLLDFTSDWIDLIPGVNVIDIEIAAASSGQPEISVTYYDTWM